MWERCAYVVAEVRGGEGGRGMGMGMGGKVHGTGKTSVEPLAHKTVGA